MCNVRLRLSTLAAALLVSAGAQADDYHYNNMLIGERASGMGGAYTAISDDASGLFYNPAGTAYAGGRNLSASVNAYHMNTTRYKDAIGSYDWTRESAGLLPNYFGVIQPLGKGVVGFSYAVTDSIQENQDQAMTFAGVPSYILNLNNDDSTYKLGPSYAREIADGLSVGVTLYAHIRSSETISNQQIEFTNLQTGTNGYESSVQYLQSNEIGFEPVLGIMWSPVDRLAFGASVRQTQLLSSKFDSQRTGSSCIDPPDTTDPVTQVETITPAVCTDLSDNSLVPGFQNSEIQHLTLERSYPINLRLGVAYFPTERLILAADMSYYNEAKGVAGARVDSPFRTKTAVTDLSAGLEYYVSSQWAVRGGIFTSMASTPSLSSNELNQPEHVDLSGFSATATRFTRNSSLTMGMAYSFGSGKAQVVAQPEGETPLFQTAEISNLTLFLSTSVSY